MLVILLFGLLTGKCDCSWLITDDCRLSVSNTCLTYEQVTVGQQYLRASQTRDCQWLHGVSPSPNYGSNLQNKVWVNMISDGCQSLIKARPLFKVKPGQRKSGEYHMTPTPPPSKCIPGTTATRFEMIPLSCLLDSDSWLGARQI